jgi:hypothetical protein
LRRIKKSRGATAPHPAPEVCTMDNDKTYTCCLCCRDYTVDEIIEYSSARIEPSYLCVNCMRELANIYAYVEDIDNGNV